MHDMQSHEWYERINEVLLRDWAPAGRDASRDAYMGYVPTLAALLWQRATVPGIDHLKLDADLIDHLKWAEKDMGFGEPFNKERAKQVIAALKGLPIPEKP